MYDRNTLLTKIAMMHYENGYTQTRISKELGISRPTIAAFLKEAVDKEIVQIIISHPNKDIFSLENKLQNIFPDTKIVVSSTISDNKKKSVGVTAAQLLLNLLENVDSVGIGWGTTLAEVINAFNFKNYNKNIVPLIGGVVTSNVKYHSNYLVTEFSKKTNSKANLLYAPAIADSYETKLAFEKNSFISNTLSKAQNVDLAIIGIGNPLVNSNYLEHGHLSSKEINNLVYEEAIGDILTTFFDEKGKSVSTDISERMIGLNIEDLKSVNYVLGVATGNEKTDATKIALEQKIVSHLVIDQYLANSIIEKIEMDLEQ